MSFFPVTVIHEAILIWIKSVYNCGNSFKVTYYIFYEIQGRSVRSKTYAKQMSIASVLEMESPVAPFTNMG